MAPEGSPKTSPGRANNYGVPSNFPKSNPRTCQDVVDIEDLARRCAVGNGQVKLCRCWKSSTWPYCDDAHNKHNSECGDNAGPLVVKSPQTASSPLSNQH